MIYLVTVVTYLTLLVGISVWLGLRVKTQEEFMVAGRTLTWPILVGTLLSTWIGSGSIFGGGNLGFRQGFAALWQPAGAWLGIVIIYFVAGRARRFGQFTVPDIMEARYNVAARVLATIATVVSYTIIVSYQFRGGARVLHLVIPEISYEWGILITAVVATGFTIFAGLISVAYTDIANGLVIIVGTLLAVPFLLHSAGGWQAVRAALPSSHFEPLGTMSLKEALALFTPTLFLLLGNANMYQRFFAARDEREARRSVVGWVIGVMIVETLVIALAVVGSSMPQFRQLAVPETIIPEVARHGLPTVVGCLLLAAIVAIIVSTADSFLLVPATNLVRDVYQRFLDPQATERRILVLSRLAVLGLGVASYLLTFTFGGILQAALAAYSIYGAAVTPAVLAVFFWPRATPAGGTASILVGTVVWFIWEIRHAFFLGGGERFPFGIETIYSSLLASIVTLIVVSLLTAPQPDKARPFAVAPAEAPD
ncbi:MAG TPA: sodium:solute symporter family protein [Candidatus Polarisedimenticolia bacterium]|nr:sodium:solute symporter family protein [Candidatus Polarisedimenticolia bacterium]